MFTHGSTSRILVAAVGFLIVASAIARPSHAGTPAPAPSPFDVTRANPPVRFEPNVGQFADGVRFAARAAGGAILVDDNAVVFSSGGSRVRMSAAGARHAPIDKPGRLLPGISNYLLGDDPELWTTGVPGYDGVTRQDIYDGVDLALHARCGRVEYDFIVAPGRDASVIQLAFDGAEAVEVSDDGTLILHTRAGTIRHRAPVAYQDVDGARRPVIARFERHIDGTVGFAVDAFDAAAPLIVDPVVEFSLVFGGSSDETITDIKTTGDGGLVLAGWTSSFDIPLAHPIQRDPNESSVDSFITRLDATGSNLVFSTYLGGRSGDDKIAAVALDPVGGVFVTGLTQSTDFPLASPLRAESVGYVEGFVTEITPDGTSLVYSTYLGGDGVDAGTAISVDSNGRATVAGYTGSRNFPRVRAMSLHRGGSFAENVDAFVATIGPRGAALELSTVFGGDYDDTPSRVITFDGGIAVAGSTRSSNFPTENAFISRYSNGDDVFVMSFAPGAKKPVFSTYLSGDYDEYVFGLMRDTNGDIVVAGSTDSRDFPTVRPLQVDEDSIAGDAFVTRFRSSGSVIFSTYFGSRTQHDFATDAEMAPDGTIYLYGITQSLDFPEVNPLQPNPGAGYYVAGFLSQLSGQGDRVIMSSYLTGYGYSGGISLDGSGNFWLMGYVDVANLDIRNPFDAPAYSTNPTISRFLRSSASLELDASAPDPVGAGTLVTVPVTMTNIGPGDAGDLSLRIRIAEGGQLAFVRGATAVFTVEGGSEAGDHIASVNRLGPSQSVTVELGIVVTAAPGSSLEVNCQSTTTAWLGGEQAPSLIVHAGVVAQPVAPPVITSSKFIGEGETLRVRIGGSGYQPGVTVFAGDATSPWTPAKLKGSNAIVLKGGSSVAARFPSGIQVPIRVVNPDGGEATALVIR